ncbi:MAG: hypothetical protein GY935_03410, partial [Gammaproteobacteria bacterium]|nr:hypothetical protein [Gammaproteobacteria bacterium]
MTYSHKHRIITLLSLLLLGILLPVSGVHSDTRVQLSNGFIASVGIETDDDGNPLIAEYDSDGRFVSDIGTLGVGDFKDVTFYAASAWRTYAQFHDDLESSDTIDTQGAQLMSAEQYQSRSFTTRTTNQAITKPDLLSNTKSVYVISEDQMLTATPIKEGFILAEYPIALHTGIEVAASRVSLIINKKGEIIRQSDYDISFKADIYKRDDSGKRIKSRDG